MSSYRNLRIKTITIPETDDEDKLTGKMITLEVASMEILNTVTQAFEGGTVYSEKIVFVCFVKDEGSPQELRIIYPEEYESIIIKRYEHENNEFGNRSNTKKRESRREGTDNNA